MKKPTGKSSVSLRQRCGYQHLSSSRLDTEILAHQYRKHILLKMCLEADLDDIVSLDIKGQFAVTIRNIQTAKQACKTNGP